MANGHPWSWHALAVTLGWMCLWVAVELFVTILAVAATLATGQAGAHVRRTHASALHSQRAALAQAPLVGVMTLSPLIATQLAGALLALVTLGGALFATATMALRGRDHEASATGASLGALAVIAGPLSHALGAMSLATVATMSVSATVVWLAATLMFTAGVAVAGTGVRAALTGPLLGGIGAGAVAFCVCALVIPPFTQDQLVPATVIAALAPTTGRLLTNQRVSTGTSPASPVQLTPMFSTMTVFAPAWLLLLL